MAKKSAWQPEVSAFWWLKHRFFLGYMLREATVIPLLFFLGCVLAGWYQLQQGAEAYAAWQTFMRQPWVVSLNGLALVASLAHAWTFFRLFPRVMPVRLGQWSVPARWLIAGQWLGVVLTLLAVTLVLWRVAYG